MMKDKWPWQDGALLILALSLAGWLMVLRLLVF